MIDDRYVTEEQTQEYFCIDPDEIISDTWYDELLRRTNKESKK